MVKQWKWIGIICGVVFALGASANTSIKVQNTQLILGEALTLTVRGETAVKQFERLSLLPLQKDFVVEVVDSQTERLRLKLYPVSSGEFVLPEIALKNTKLKQQLVKVAKNSEININWPQMPVTVYPQQLLVESLSLELPSEKWRFKLEPPVMNAVQAEQWQARSLKVLRNEQNLNRYQLTNLYEFNAFVEPLTRVQVSLPRMHLKIRQPNGRYWHFYSPNQAINISALPSFLPSASLVSQLKWHSHRSSWSELNTINYWNWSLSATNVPQVYLQQLAQQILAQLQTIDSVEWLSAEITEQQTLNHGKLIQSLQMQVPYRPKNVLWSVPEIQIGYFNPQTAKWQQESLPAGWNLSLPAWLKVVTQLIGALLFVWMIWQLVERFRVIYLWRRLIAEARAAQSPQEVSTALFAWQSRRQLKSLVGAPDDRQRLTTYGDWLAHYQLQASSEQAKQAAEDLIALLQKNSYAKPESLQAADHVFDDIKTALDKWLKSESIWRQCLHKSS